MTKKHYIQIAICSLLIVICGMIFYAYYRDYIAPESYVIGKNSEMPYKELMVSDYVSDENVLFSMNINSQSFLVENNVAVYQYNFAVTDFDADKTNYSLFVNNDIVLHQESAGTLKGVHMLNFYDVNKNCLSTVEVSIDFAFYSLHSTLRVSLDSSKLGYLMNYFKTDNYIITLTKSVFESENEIASEEKTIKLTLDNKKGYEIVVVYNEEEITIPAVTTVNLDVKSTDYIFIKNMSSYFTSSGVVTASAREDGVMYSWVNEEQLIFTFSSQPIYST